MGCNCKKKYDVFKKYSDNPDGNDENTNIFWKIIVFIARFIFWILLAPLIIVITVPFLVYIIICLMFGIEPVVNLKIPFKKKK